MSMMVSTKKSVNAELDHSGIRIVYDTSQERDLVDSLAKELERSHSTRSLVSNLSETNAQDQIVIIVDHASGSLLLEIDERKLEILKSIVAQAKGILWITFGGLGNGKDAGAGAVSGLLRTLRSENGGMNFVSCDIDPEDLSKHEVPQSISRVFAKAFSKSNMTSPVKDFEYAIQNGRIMIPRLIEDKLANEATTTRLSKREPEKQSLWQKDSCLCLDMGQAGLLDTFQFVHSEKCSGEIHDSEVEIEIKMAGLNFHDLMVATGQLPNLNGYGGECAGIVTKVGKATHNLKIGDRVCAIASSSFANRTRTSEELVSVMPDSMSFEIGASIPSVFTTAYYCIHTAANLQENECILIHSAAGGIGQACIKMAQLIGAEVFVTAGSPAKVDFLEQTFGLPRSHILDSRTLKFGHEIFGLTEGRGVDVIINSLAGDALRESWRCLATFGRFIELGKRDTVENTRLDMAPFERSASFISVGWDHFCHHRPKFVGSVLQEIVKLFGNGILTPMEPITKFPMSAIEPAFRFMASGTHMGKIVVVAEEDCLVKVRMKHGTLTSLLTDRCRLFPDHHHLCGSILRPHTSSSVGWAVLA